MASSPVNVEWKLGLEWLIGAVTAVAAWFIRLEWTRRDQERRIQELEEDLGMLRKLFYEQASREQALEYKLDSHVQQPGHPESMRMIAGVGDSLNALRTDLVRVMQRLDDIKERIGHERERAS